MRPTTSPVLMVRKETMPIFSVLSLFSPFAYLLCLTSLPNIPIHCNQRTTCPSQRSGKARAEVGIQRGLNMSTAPDVSTLAPSRPVPLPSSEDRRLDGSMSLSSIPETISSYCPAKNTQDPTSDQVAMPIIAYYCLLPTFILCFHTSRTLKHYPRTHAF